MTCYHVPTRGRMTTRGTAALTDEYSVQIDDEKMQECPICSGKAIKGPHYKRATQTTPIVLAYTCNRCSYTQYVHTGDNLFLKSVMIKPV